MTVRNWDAIRRLDGGRAVWGTVASHCSNTANANSDDWQTNPKYGYAETGLAA